jgi:HK97 family phage portal protein
MRNPFTTLILAMARRVDPAPVHQAGFMGGPATAGVHVTAETAVKVSSLFRGAVTISDTLKGLPWDIFDKDGDELTKVQGHELWDLLNKAPNPEMPAAVFRAALAFCAVIRGQSFAEIERSVQGVPIGLWPIGYDRVESKRDGLGRLYYHVRNDGRDDVDIAPANMLHIRGASLDGVASYDPLDLGKESIGAAMAGDQYVGSFFGNSATPSGVLQTDQALSQEGYENVKKSWNESYRGAKRANKVAVLEQGLQYKQTSIDPEKSQLKDTRSFQVDEMARIIGVPPHKIGKLADATFSNIEQQNRDFIDHSIMPWVTTLQQEVDQKLLNRPGDAGRVSIMNLNALRKGDLKTMGEFYTMMVDRGIMSINEVRFMLGENSIGPEGDVYRIAANIGGTAPQGDNE